MTNKRMKTYRPTRKVTLGAVAGAVVTLLSAFGIEMSAEVASALATLVIFAVSYVTRPSPQDKVVEDGV